MKRCSNCSHPVNPGAAKYVGSVVYPGVYLAVFTCSCGGTYGCVLHEVPDDESDEQESEAA